MTWFSPEEFLRREQESSRKQRPKVKTVSAGVAFAGLRAGLSPLILSPSCVEVGCKSVATTNCTPSMSGHRASASLPAGHQARARHLAVLPISFHAVGLPRERAREKNRSPLPHTSPPNVAILWWPGAATRGLLSRLLELVAGLQHPLTAPPSLSPRRMARITTTSGPSASPLLIPKPPAAIASLPATGYHSPGHIDPLPPTVACPLCVGHQPRVAAPASHRCQPPTVAVISHASLRHAASQRRRPRLSTSHNLPPSLAARHGAGCPPTAAGRCSTQR